MLTNRKNILIITIFLFVLSYPVYLHATIATRLVSGRVLDKKTGEPIRNAIVYPGTGDDESRRRTTDIKGEFKIPVYCTGVLNVYKKGYLHSGKFMDLSTDNINFELEKVPIQQITLKGKIIEQIVAKGTYSENHYLKIEISPEVKMFIFDKIGYNRLSDREKWIGKKVRIEGYKGMGTAGWQWDHVEGIYIEHIKLLP